MRHELDESKWFEMGLWKFLAFAKLISWEHFKSELVSPIPGPVWVFFSPFFPSLFVTDGSVYTEKTHRLFQMLDWLNFQHGTMMLCCLVWITVRLIRLSLEQPWYTEYVAQGCHMVKEKSGINMKFPRSLQCFDKIKDQRKSYLMLWYTIVKFFFPFHKSL